MPGVFEPLRDDDPREVGGYRLYARLGAGGMGQVFLSFLPGGRPVAVKVVRRELADDPEFRARFAVEASAAQRVSGVHIAPLLDARPDAQPPWLVTAYVAGPALGEAVRRFGPLPPAAVRALVAEVAAALREVHAAGIVHRDLKPANVVLAADNPRVIDFGVARAADATTATVMGVRVGSPQYMAPEQVEGSAATPATDVFALGALAYFAATGRPAFGEGPEVGVAHRILHGQPSLDGCPPDLLDLVRACLAKDPAARPTTDQVIDACRPAGTVPEARQWLPAEVLADIQARDEAVAAAARLGPPRSASTLGSRRRTLALALAAVLLGAAAGVAVTVRALDDPAGAVSTDGTSPAASAATGTASASSPSPSGETATPSAPPDDVQYRGEVRFDDDGIDFDHVPPRVAQVVADLAVDLHRNQASVDGLLTADRLLALWPGSDMPSRQQCADLVDTQGDERAHIPVGRIGCLRTNKDRIAMFRVTKYPEDSFDVTAQVTVWSATDS